MKNDDINAIIGARIKKLRNDRQLTLEMLSDKTGVSVSMLSAIERNRKSPTLTILNKIKSGLKISLSEIFDDAGNDDRVLVRKSDMRVINRKNGGELTVLFECVSCNRFEVMRQQIAPKSKWKSEGHFDGNTWEYCLVVEGNLAMTVDDQSYLVGQGEAFYFMANVPHAYINNADEPLSLIVVNAYR